MRNRSTYYHSGQCRVPQEIEGESVSGEEKEYRRDHGPRAVKIGLNTFMTAVR